MRDPRPALAPLVARADRQRGQSLTEYVLILAVVIVAAVAVLGMVSSAVSAHLDPLATVLRAEGNSPSLQIPFALPPLIVMSALIVGAVGLYVFRLRRG